MAMATAAHFLTRHIRASISGAASGSLLGAPSGSLRWSSLAALAPGWIPFSSHSKKPLNDFPPPPPPSPHLHLSVEPLGGADEGVSLLTLSRPEARNAIGRQLLKELAEALELIRKETTTRCLILRSTVPGVFSVGCDLKEHSLMTPSEATEFTGEMRRTLTQLRSLPIPTIAVVEGAACGAGAELALCCDLRVLGPVAAFAFPEVRLGVILANGGTQILPRLIGAPKAKELIFSGRKVDAEEALEIGLAEHGALALDGGGGPGDATTAGPLPSSSSSPALDKALVLAREISKGSPLALTLAKEAINLSSEVHFNVGLRYEEACYARLQGASAQYRKATAATAESESAPGRT